MADREVLDLGQLKEDERRDREDVEGRTGDVELFKVREPSEDALGVEQPLGCVLRVHSIGEGDSPEGRKQASEQVLQRGHLGVDAQIFEFGEVESDRREDGGVAPSTTGALVHRTCSVRSLIRSRTSGGALISFVFHTGPFMEVRLGRRSGWNSL